MSERLAGRRAGVGAQHRFEELLTAWRRRVGKGLAFATVLLVVPGVALVLLTSGWWQVGAAFYVGAFFGMALWVWDAPPEHIERWRRGAAGERRTAKVLRGLSRLGWTVIHDVPRDRSNWDHVLIGPGGVFLLDSKNLLGEPVVEGGVLRVRRHEAPEDSHAFDRLPGFMRASAMELKNELAARTGISVFVSAVVVVWPHLHGQAVEAERVTYVGGDDLRGWLECRPRRLGDDACHRLAAAVQAMGASVGPPADRASHSAARSRQAG